MRKYKSVFKEAGEGTFEDLINFVKSNTDENNDIFLVLKTDSAESDKVKLTGALLKKLSSSKEIISRIE
jgi:hypothetical protein